MREDIVPGAKFPDYQLTGTDKRRHKLSELQGTDPMALVLARGHYCPRDHQQPSRAGRPVPEDQRRLEIQGYTDPHHDPMIPHTLVLEPGW
jgi:hypothetical protein